MYQITYHNSIIARGETRADCIAQLANHEPFPTTIEIETRGDHQHVTICNNVWVKKRVENAATYSLEFNRREILRDIAEKVCRMNGYALERIEL